MQILILVRLIKGQLVETGVTYKFSLPGKYRSLRRVGYVEVDFAEISFLHLKKSSHHCTLWLRRRDHMVKF